MSEQQIILPIRTKKELMDFARASNQLHNDQHRNLVVTLTEDINLGGKRPLEMRISRSMVHLTAEGIPSVVCTSVKTEKAVTVSLVP